MWLARLGGLLVGVGTFVALRGWYRTWPAPSSAASLLVLSATVVAVAEAIAGRLKLASPSLRAWARWAGGSGIVLGAVAWLLVMMIGVRHDGVYARGDLGRIADGLGAFQRDSGRAARSADDLDRRYRSYQAYVGWETMTIRATPDGWTAEVRPTRTLQTCAIYEGSTPLAPATAPGVAACTREPHGSGFWIGWLMVAIGVPVGASAALMDRRPAIPVTGTAT